MKVSPHLDLIWKTGGNLLTSRKAAFSPCQNYERPTVQFGAARRMEFREAMKLLPASGKWRMSWRERSMYAKAETNLRPTGGSETAFRPAAAMFRPSEIRRIIEAVSELSGVPQVAILGACRQPDIAFARHAAMWCARTITGRSFPHHRSRVRRQGPHDGDSRLPCIRETDKRWRQEQTTAGGASVEQAAGDDVPAWLSTMGQEDVRRALMDLEPEE